MNSKRKISRGILLMLCMTIVTVMSGSAVFSKNVDPQEDMKTAATDTVAADFTDGVSLKDGTYKAAGFGWSGGSGRLSYIHCVKLQIRDGQAYATIEFGSESYDTLKVDGKSYTKEGDGNSRFTIPVNVNRNTKITGRTTAMSQAHWIDYDIYVAIDAGDGQIGMKTKVRTDRLNTKAPEIMGLEYQSEVATKEAELFKIYRYNDGISLLQIDISSKSVLDYSDSEAASGQEGIYQHNVVNYLVVPEGVEAPAGLDSKLIIVNSPVRNSSEIDDAADMDYKSIVQNKVDMVILQNKAIKGFLFFKGDKQENIEALEESMAALDVPVLFDRSDAESSGGADEWNKVYKLFKK